MTMVVVRAAILPWETRNGPHEPTRIG
jgi:hypothetical protein